MKNENKITIGDELTGLENISSLHDGENTLVAETAVFTGSTDSGFSGALSCLTIKDIEGETTTISLPLGFVEKLAANVWNHIYQKQPVKKTKKGFEKFKKDFRSYFNHEATDEFIAEIYYSEVFPICFITSTLYINDLKDKFDLSANILFD